MTSTTYPSVSDALRETVPVVEAIPAYGPPLIVLVGPWLLLVLMFIGPFALMVTLAVALVAVALVLALVAAIVASPFLLVRHLHRHHRPVHALRVAAARLFAPREIQHHQEATS